MRWVPVRRLDLRHWLLTLTLGGALLVLLGGSVMLGASAWFAARAERLAAQPDADLTGALAAIALARHLDPWSAARLRSEGQLLERLAAAAPPAEARAWLARALAADRAALVRQPGSGYASAALLRVLLKTGAPVAEIDAQFAHAIRRGRWEPGVQRSLIDTGLGAWAVLSPVQQDHLIEVISAGLNTQPVWVMAAATRTGRWDVLGPVVAVLAADDPMLETLARSFMPRSPSAP